jgi:hypothetical protein
VGEPRGIDALAGPGRAFWKDVAATLVGANAGTRRPAGTPSLADEFRRGERADAPAKRPRRTRVDPLDGDDSVPSREVFIFCGPTPSHRDDPDEAECSELSAAYADPSAFAGLSITPVNVEAGDRCGQAPGGEKPAE